MKNVMLIFALSLLPALVNAKPITVQVKGMVCAFCAQGIEKKFKARPEILSVSVSLETKKVALNTKEGSDIADTEISKIITEAGYDIVAIERAK